MELNEFISGVLQDITQAVESTQHRYKTDNQEMLSPIVCPSEIETDKEHCIERDIRRYITYVDFDVALAVSETDGKDGKAGVRTKIVDFCRGTEHGEHSELVQRIRFRIPIVLPSIKTRSNKGRNNVIIK